MPSILILIVIPCARVDSIFILWKLVYSNRDMKIIILLCVAVIIAAYGFLQWSGSNIGVAKSGRASDIAPLKSRLNQYLEFR